MFKFLILKIGQIHVFREFELFIGKYMMRLNYLEDAFPGIYHVVKTQQKSNFSGTSSKFAKK